jgi:hypothetical protein
VILTVWVVALKLVLALKPVQLVVATVVAGRTVWPSTIKLIEGQLPLQRWAVALALIVKEVTWLEKVTEPAKEPD